MDKRIVEDASLSWKSKGILLYAFSRPNDWSFYKSEIMKHASDGESSFDSGVKQLEELGYLYRRRHRISNGRFFGWEWHFFETPISEEEFKKRCPQPGIPVVGDSPGSEKSSPTKKDLYNKNEKNNNKQPSKPLINRSSKEPSAPVVVFSCLGKLKISDRYKLELCKKMDEQKAEKLVERVFRWENRECDDAKACNTILGRWETWGDAPTLKQREELKAASDRENTKVIKKRREKALNLKKQFPNFNMRVCEFSLSFKQGNGWSVMSFLEDKFEKLIDSMEGWCFKNLKKNSLGI
jgi:hypothetical protein